MWKIVLAAILTLALIGPAAAQIGEITHDKTIQHYDFNASTLGAARKNAFAASTIEENGRTFMGYTWSNWTWNIKWKQSGGLCRVTRADIEVDTTVTLPRWANVNRASVKARDEWIRYAAAIEGHEQGHVEINLAAMRDLKAGLLALEPRRSCKALLSAGRTFSDANNAAVGRRHTEYDRTTRHGATQGAKLRMD
jgi:predicted secreted Zn-dependent protease